MLRILEPAERRADQAGNAALDRVAAATRWLVTTVALLFAIGASVLVWALLRHEDSQARERLDRDLAEVAQTLRGRLLRDAQAFQMAIGQSDEAVDVQRAAAQVAALSAERPELLLVQWRDAAGIEHVQTSPLARAAASAVTSPSHESFAARGAARLGDTPVFSDAYFVPLPEHAGLHVIELWLPSAESSPIWLRAVYALPALLAERVPEAFARRHELALTAADDSSLARHAPFGRGAGVYRARALLDLPGTTMVLRADSLRTAPRFLPNLLTGLVIALSAALLVALARLMRDVRRRALAEAALQDAYAFREAMEDSLVTGLRARDLQGRITYVNPAFCQMVGFEAEELVGCGPPMPYWAPEAIDEYRQRHAQMLAGTVTRHGHESVWMRRGGERFPVLIFEAALIDAAGRHTGWMSSVLDLTESRRAEEINRQQSEKLQQAARMATMGELATVLSHELNQPLAAISSYATGASNLLAAERQDPARLHEDLREALGRIAAQAQRAARVVRRVNDFMRRRPVRPEVLDAAEVVGALQPLFDLQARKAAVRLRVQRPADPLAVSADRVLLEQVLLNLTRNGIEAMRQTPAQRRLLDVRVAAGAHRTVRIEVTDCGCGIAPEIAEQVFAPFFTTKQDGLGMGLGLCRSVAEQAGGRLWHEPRPDGGTVFVLSMPQAAP